MGPRSDAEVIAISLDQPASFSEIYDRHGATILRYLVRRVGPAAAEPLLGDTFRVAFERRETFDPCPRQRRTLAVRDRRQPAARHRRSEARWLRELLGYSIGPAFMGHVDGRHPEKLVSRG